MSLYKNQQAENEADIARVQFADSPDVLAAMGSYYGMNLKDQVNIHDDESSHDMVAKEGVDALASGKDIYFGEGAYNMGNRDSRGLLAHETAHVIQQGGLLGMNQNVSYGARQGSFLRAVGAIALNTLSAIGGAVTGLFWRAKIGDVNNLRSFKLTKSNTGPKKKDEKTDLLANIVIKSESEKKIQYDLNPAQMHNGFIPLADGVNNYGGNTEIENYSNGAFGDFQRYTSAPKIAAQYDYRDNGTTYDEGDYSYNLGARKSFNNAAEFVSLLKHRLLSSTITGSIIYALINWNVHYLRRAWPVRLVTSVIRQVGTWGVGLWKGLKILFTSRGSIANSDGRKWWNENAGEFFLPFIGRKVHRFINWIRKKLTPVGENRKNAYIQDRASLETRQVDRDLGKIANTYDDDNRSELSLDTSYGGSLENIPANVSQGAVLDPTGPNVSIPNLDKTNSEESNDKDEPVEGEPLLKDFDPNMLPDNAKAALMSNMTAADIAKLPEEEQNEMIKDIISNEKSASMLETLLTSEDMEKLKNTDEAIRNSQNSGNQIENQVPTMLENGAPMPMMPPIAGPEAKSGPITFQNADGSLGDGWEDRPNSAEKKEDCFEEVLSYNVTLGNDLVGKLRSLKDATREGVNLNADGITQYELALETVNKLDDSTEETRTAKAWAMRFLRCINSSNKSKAA